MLSLFNTGYGLQDQLDGVKNGIAIVSTGGTHIAITSGQYVYIQDHSTLAEGLYRATANIAANGTLSSSNVTAVSGGGLNALNSNITKLDSNRNFTNDVLADAVTATETTFFRATGSTNYTGTIPNENYKYGTFTVNVRDLSKYVTAVSIQGEVATNVYSNGAWRGWEQLALNSNVNNTNDLTAATGVTIDYGKYSKVGRVVTFTVQLTLSAQKAAGSELLNGLPNGVVLNNVSFIATDITSASTLNTFLSCRLSADRLITNVAFSATSYTITGSYISSN